MSITTDPAARHAVLVAIAAANELYGPDEADTISVANRLGTTNPELLGSPRERILTALRSEGLIAIRRKAGRVTWGLTPAGSSELSSYI